MDAEMMAVLEQAVEACGGVLVIKNGLTLERAIGLKMSQIRDKFGLTTTELAKRVGISQAQISRLENGKQGFRSGRLKKIAQALGIVIVVPYGA